MRRLALLVICAILTVFPAHGAVPQWVTTGAKSPSLETSTDAHASLLYGKTVISYAAGYIQLEEQTVVRILTAEGLGAGSLVVQFDDESSLTGVHGWRLNSAGGLEEELKSENIQRVALNLSFVDDSRQLIGRFDNVEKGDVVAFTYRLRVKTLFRDIYLPLGGRQEIVRHDIVIQGMPRSAVLNDPSGYVAKTADGYRVTGVPVLKRQPSQPPLRDRVPLLAISYHGEGESWESFGKYYWGLTGHLFNLDAGTKADMSDVVSFENRTQYIRDVIDFVSGNINYVDIELGVGGYVPHPCGFVLEKRYGDCKDMAFLAAAMLREKGIDAYPVLAKGRRHGRVYPEFPGNQFNHVILGVQLDENETDLANAEVDGYPFLFADLTDRITDLPYLPDGLEGSHGLLVRENGGTLVQLPWSKAESNHRYLDIHAGLRLNGSVAVELHEVMTGQPAFDELRMRDDLTREKEDRAYRNWIQRMIPGAQLKRHEVVSDDQKVETRFEFTAPRYGVETGEGRYVILNIVDANRKNIYPRGERLWDIRRGTLESKHVHVEWFLPLALKVKEIPEDVSIDNEFYTLSRTVCEVSGSICMDFRITWKVNEVPAEAYKAYRKAYRKYLSVFKAPLLVQ